VKEFLSQNKITHVYLDITESMANLKSFLKLRDSRPEFDEIKKRGSIGIPCIVVNGGDKLIFDVPKLTDLLD